MLIDTPSSASGWAFPAEEYQARAARLRNVMRQEGVALLIIDQFEHLAYYTGHIPTAAMYQCCLFPLDGEPVMIVRSLDGPMLAEMSWVRDRLLFDDSEDPLARVAQEIHRRGWQRLAIGVETDSHFLLPARWQRLKETLPEATFIDFAGHMWTLRLLKSAREIDLLRRGCLGAVPSPRRG